LKLQALKVIFKGGEAGNRRW